MPAGTHAALILAAGFSTRMRSGFKPLLPIPFADGRRSALEALARLYIEAGVPRILVVSGQRQGEAIAADAARLGLAHARNPDAERGMFSSIRVGLEALGLSHRGCFVHPVDVPLVRACVLRALLARNRDCPEVVLIPTFKGEEGHPPLLPATHVPAILAWSGQDGLRGVLRALPCCPTPVADGSILLDMDTDEDHADVCRRAARRHILEPEEAYELLRCRNIGPRGMAHARAVGCVARHFADACNAAGRSLDPDMAEAGGLLHDLCKGEPQHERAAGRELRALGLPAMARLVEEHRDCALAEDAPVTEKELVYLADKYVYGDRLVDVRTRFGQKLTLFAQDAEAGAAIRGRLARAEAMELRLRKECGKAPLELARAALAEPEREQ